MDNKTTSAPIFTTEITDPVLITQYLEKASWGLCRLDLLGEDKSLNLKTSLLAKYNSTDKLIYFTLPPELQNRAVPLNYTATCYVNNEIIGFPINIQGSNSTEAWFKIPVKAFKINRREAFRFKFPRAYEHMVEIVDSKNFKKTKYRIFDLSSDGLAFEIPESLQGSFKTGDKINRINFSLKGNDFCADVVVRGCFKSSEGNLTFCKVGVQFVKFYEGHKWQVTNFVTSSAILFMKKAI